MVRACELDMCNGEYVFVMPAMTASESFERSQPWKTGDGREEAVKHALRYLLFVSPHRSNWRTFCLLIKTLIHVLFCFLRSFMQLQWIKTNLYTTRKKFCITIYFPIYIMQNQVISNRNHDKTGFLFLLFSNFSNTFFLHTYMSFNT